MNNSILSDLVVTAELVTSWLGLGLDDCGARFVIGEVKPVAEDLNTAVHVMAQPLREEAGREAVDHKLAEVARIVVGEDLRCGHALHVEGLVQKEVHLSAGLG